MQNSTGGWSSYERRRGPMWLEWINPSEVFGDIMVDCDYPECTTSVGLFARFYATDSHFTGHHSALHLQEALPALSDQRYQVGPFVHFLLGTHSLVL